MLAGAAVVAALTGAVLAAAETAAVGALPPPPPHAVSTLSMVMLARELLQVRLNKRSYLGCTFCSSLVNTLVVKVLPKSLLLACYRSMGLG